MSEAGGSGLRPARFPEEAALVRGLFQDYFDALGVDLSFQNVDAELADLPGGYGPPGGALLLGAEGLGCVALRPGPEPEICEMKRLYVDPAARGTGLGRDLAQAILAEGRRLGYRRMVLDTLERLGPAVRLYHRLGFTPIPPYTYNPVPGVIFLGRDL